MRCLLDKVTARYMMRGLLKLSLSQMPIGDEVFALKLFSNRHHLAATFFISPATANVLLQFAQTARYTNLIQLFRTQVQIAQPLRYHKRWSRRIRQLGFTREDAAILALATFGGDVTDRNLGMDSVVTFDQPMINHWLTQQATIQAKLTAMCADVSPPYHQARLPQVLRPQEINR